MSRIKKIWLHQVGQSLLAMLFMLIVLLFMNHFSPSDILWAVGAGSLSSSSYIVYCFWETFGSHCSA